MRPPVRSRASRTRTVQPACTSLRAAAIPLMPAPMIITSASRLGAGALSGSSGPGNDIGSTVTTLAPDYALRIDQQRPVHKFGCATATLKFQALRQRSESWRKESKRSASRAFLHQPRDAAHTQLAQFPCKIQSQEVRNHTDCVFTSTHWTQRRCALRESHHGRGHERQGDLVQGASSASR